LDNRFDKWTWTHLQTKQGKARAPRKAPHRAFLEVGRCRKDMRLDQMIKDKTTLSPSQSGVRTSALLQNQVISTTNDYKDPTNSYRYSEEYSSSILDTEPQSPPYPRNSSPFIASIPTNSMLLKE